MKKALTIAAAALAGFVVVFIAILVLIAARIEATPPVQRITIELESRVARSFKGAIVVDGKRTNLEGPLPNTVSATGRDIAYTFLCTSKASVMTVQLSIDGRLASVVTASQGKPIVRGRVADRKASQWTDVRGR